MAISFEKVDYRKLNSRQQEAYNFQKISAVLADFGYLTIRLSDDWNGADFIAQHFKSKSFIGVQLKGRLCFYQKYCERICTFASTRMASGICIRTMKC